MIITPRDALYLLRVSDRIDALPLTARCPECDQPVGDDVDTAHVMMRRTDGRAVVVIGCEGYWLADPTLVGLPRGQWQPQP